MASITLSGEKVSNSSCNASNSIGVMGWMLSENFLTTLASSSSIIGSFSSMGEYKGVVVVDILLSFTLLCGISADINCGLAGLLYAETTIE